MFASVKPVEPSIIFNATDGREILKITHKGEFLFEGRKITTDAQIENALRRFLIDQGYLKDDRINRFGE